MRGMRRYVFGLGSGYQWSPTRFSDCPHPPIYINNLPNNLKSTVRLFADDTIIYMTISNGTDAIALQQDLDKLAKWEETWQMEFHPQKCVLHITRSTKYLGMVINKTLSWNNYINEVTKKQMHPWISYEEISKLARKIKNQCLFHFN